MAMAMDDYDFPQQLTCPNCNEIAWAMPTVGFVLAVFCEYCGYEDGPKKAAGRCYQQLPAKRKEYAMDPP
jgi:ssDNA-binding Zn-finger/Zn-ribbon topoisomerase 1